MDNVSPYPLSPMKQKAPSLLPIPWGGGGGRRRPTICAKRIRGREREREKGELPAKLPLQATYFVLPLPTPLSHSSPPRHLWSFRPLPHPPWTAAEKGGKQQHIKPHSGRGRRHFITTFYAFRSGGRGGQRGGHLPRTPAKKSSSSTRVICQSRSFAFCIKPVTALRRESKEARKRPTSAGNKSEERSGVGKRKMEGSSIKVLARPE